MAKGKLLIIDTQTSARGALRNYFERRGYEVAEAASGDEALVQFQEFRPNALVVDYHLRDEDNNKLIGQIQSVLPDVPIIMVAYYESIEQALQPVNHSAPLAMTDANSPLAEIEKRHIERVLCNNRGNIEKSARALEISRSSLYERVKRYGIKYP
jgi:DNA-binding NtrC family response regulator